MKDKSPAPIRFLKATAREIKNRVQGITLTREEITKRREICGGCEHRNKRLNTCKLCDCFIKLKTTYHDEHCPDERW